MSLVVGSCTSPPGVWGSIPTSGKNMWSDHTMRCDHTISKKWTFVHTEMLFTPSNSQNHTVIILFTSSRCYSHSWNFGSHHLNFVHTISLYSHSKIELFTPSTFLMFVTKRIVLAFINNTTPITSHLVGRFFAMYCVAQCSCPPTEWLWLAPTTPKDALSAGI